MTTDEQTAKADAVHSRAQRRAALLDQVIALVRAEGAGAGELSMERLAEGCGITKPILYRHFEGRDGLVEAVAERYVAELGAALVPILRSEVPAVHRLREAICAYLELLEREHGLYRFLSVAAADHGGPLVAMVAEQTAEAIERLLGARGVDPAPSRAWAYGLVGMVHLAGDWWITNGPYDRSTLVDHLISILEPGIRELNLDDAAPSPDTSAAGSPTLSVVVDDHR